MRELNFTHWNQDYINALSDEDYDILKRAEKDLANRLQVFLDAYDFRPDEYQGERYIHSQELSPRVFGSLVDEKEYCIKFDEDTILQGVRSGHAGMVRIHTSTLRWIKLSDVPRIVDRYSDSIYQNKTPARLHAVNQLVTKQREYMAILNSIGQEIPSSEIRTNRNTYLPEKAVEEGLANGRKLKATVDKTIEVDVVQWERNTWGESKYEFGRELFYFSAKINPQTDIDDEGYVTQAWFYMDQIQDIQELNGETWVLMKPSRFAIPDPVVYFGTSIDGSDARLIPHPDF